MSKLTENSIRKAEIHDKQYKIYDGEGMFMLIHPNGSKYWRMKYTFDGKSKLASFGVWPGVSLKEARKMRQAARNKIKIGINPVEEKRRKKHVRQTESEGSVKNHSVKSSQYSSVSKQIYKIISPLVKVRETEESIHYIKSMVFGNVGIKSESFIDKNGLKQIFDNIWRNRRDLFNFIWDYFICFPILNIIVLFLILLIMIGFLPALLATVLYFVLAACIAFVFCVWDEKKV